MNRRLLLGVLMNMMLNIADMSVDELVVFRAKILLFGALAFALWQFGWIATDAIANTNQSAYGVAAIITTLGAIGWVTTAILLFKLNQKIKQADVLPAMQDELVLKNRSTAFFQSYFVLFGLVWLLIPVMDYGLFDIKLAVRTIATLAIIIPMILFSIYELKNDSGADE